MIKPHFFESGASECAHNRNSNYRMRRRTHFMTFHTRICRRYLVEAHKRLGHNNNERPGPVGASKSRFFRYNGDPSSRFMVLSEGWVQSSGRSDTVISHHTQLCQLLGWPFCEKSRQAAVMSKARFWSLSRFNRGRWLIYYGRLNFVKM